MWQGLNLGPGIMSLMFYQSFGFPPTHHEWISVCDWFCCIEAIEPISHKKVDLKESSNITIVHHINVDKYYKSNGENKKNNLCLANTGMVPLLEIFTNAQNVIVNLSKWTVMFRIQIVSLVIQIEGINLVILLPVFAL